MDIYDTINIQLYSFHSLPSLQQQYIDRMLSNDSQQLPSQDNDNQFLPNRSNSYESMIKQHQERRSLILNDQLILPSSFSNQHKSHELEGNSNLDLQERMQSKNEGEQSKLGEKEMEQDEENQFLINQNSIAASIKQAIRSKESNIEGISSQQMHFLRAPHSNDDPFPSQSINQKSYNSVQQSAEDELNIDEHPFGNVSGNLEVMNSNMQSKQQSQFYDKEEEMNRNSIESDPFLNAESQRQYQNQFNQNFEQESTLNNRQMPFKNSQYSNLPNQEDENESNVKEFHNKMSQQVQQMQFLNSSFSKHSQEPSKNEEMPKSRSQIQCLHSDLQSNQHNESQKFQQLNKKVQAQSQIQQKENSLSNLMKLNYFERKYQQFGQKIESQSLVGSNDILESEVKLFRQQPKKDKLKESNSISILNESKPMIHDQESGVNDVSNANQSVDHILMTYQSKNNLNSAINPQKEESSIINNINDLSNNHKNLPLMLIEPQGSNNNNFLEQHSKNERISIEQIEMIERQHHEQIKELQLHNSRHSLSHHSQNLEEYYNEFNQESNQKQQENHYQLDIGNQSYSQRSEDIDQDMQSYHQKLVQVQHISQKSEIQSKRSHIKQQSMSSIQQVERQNTSKRSEYELHSSKSHIKQRSMVEKSSNNSSDLHLPEIDVKNKKISQISKKSNVSKKTHSIKVENDSKISIGNSKYELYSKKNSSKLQKHSRDKIVSYSQGMQFENPDEASQIYRQVQVGSTTLDSKSIIGKKKENTVKQIFNTVPEGIEVLNATPISLQIKEETNKAINEPIIQRKMKQKQNPISVRSPTKQRQDQIQRIRLLKQAQRKRLQRQLQKVKKQLEEISTREKNMQKIYEQKQKIEIKQRENLSNSRQNDFSNKITRHHRENEALMKIIKEHRKSKELNDQNGQFFQDNITKNLQQLNQIRQEAEQKLKEKKKLDIIDRMKKNEMRKINQQKLIKANNQYIQQFRSVDNPVLSPQPLAQNLSRDKGVGNVKNVSKDLGGCNIISKFIIQDKRKLLNTYQEKLD